MVAVNLRVRHAVQADQQRIASLMYHETRVHRHLDWRAPLDWLGSPHYWVLEDGPDLVAALACPQDPAGIAWIRLFVCHSSLEGMEAWSVLWETARRELATEAGVITAAISLQFWFEELLVKSGFALNQNIIMLEWDNSPVVPPQLPEGISLRPMLPGDFEAVAEVDASAFEPLWQNSLEALSRAYAQRAYATVAETSQRLVGYQISTSNPIGAHLARLAVRPETQRTGVGIALVRDLLLQFQHRGRPHITVNTQSDNLSSQALYERLGFVRTGEQFPVFVYPVQSLQ